MSPVDGAAHPAKIKKQKKYAPKKIVHYIPEPVVQYIPDRVVHFIPEYSSGLNL